MQLASGFLEKMDGDDMQMVSFSYPFLVYSTSSCWIGCKPVLIFYLFYFIISCAYNVYKRKKNENAESQKKIEGTWVYAYLSMVFLYFFSTLAGQSDILIVEIAELYLQYETSLSAIMLGILFFVMLRKLSWQYVRLLNKVVTLMILGTVSSTILARQVDSLWIGNIIWFVLLGVMCWKIWSSWDNFRPTIDSTSTSGGFQPIKSYEKLFPQQKRLVNETMDMIRSHDTNDSLSICVAGKWGSGKTSVVNGVVDRLKQETSRQYETLYINTMELDTLSSLFIYVFERIRDILKKRGAYVGIGSDYRKFLTSAVGKITDDSFATLLENRLIPSSDDYREQMSGLEECISDVLKQDKILVIVDDVERCEIDKAQQFIFFIKEIATMRNCITIFLADNEYLSQRHNPGAVGTAEELADKNYFFYEKFFNCRIDIPPIVFEEAMGQLEQTVQEKAQELRFRVPSELFDVFQDRMQKTAQKYRAEAEKKSNSDVKEKLFSSAEELDQLRMLFCSNLSIPRTLVKFCHALKAGYSRLSDMYMKNGKWKEKEEVLDFLSMIHFDEILFLLIYIEVCAPYEARCLKEQGIDFLWCPDAADNTRKLIYEMGKDLLYSNSGNFTVENEDYRYNEAYIFTQAYLDRDLPQEVNRFSSRDELWLNAIEVNDETKMRNFWPEMVQMVARNFAWRNSQEGERYLDKLFSFAKERLSNSPEGIELIFSIFDSDRHSEEICTYHIPVMKLFWKRLKDILIGRTRKEVGALKQFSTGYLWKRTSPICRAAFFMAPVEYSKDQNFQKKLSDANDIMLNGDPSDSLQKLLDKICDMVPSIRIPQNNNIFTRLWFLAGEEELYMKRAGLIQYHDIEDQIQMLKASIEDIKYFILLLHEAEKNAIPLGNFVSNINLSELDSTIHRFIDALNAPDARKDVSLRYNLQELFNAIRYSDVLLCDEHYQELQDIITQSEELFGEMPYNRIILANHRQGNEVETAPE